MSPQAIIATIAQIAIASSDRFVDFGGSVRDWWHQPSKTERLRLHAAAKEKARQAEAAEMARRVCEVCETELESQRDGKVCRKCGSAQISTRGELRDRKKTEERRRMREQAEMERQEKEQIEAKLANQAAARHQEERKVAARERCRTIATGRYCAKCQAEREYAGKYCEICGAVLELIPVSVAFTRANDEFPDVVHTEDDYKRFVKRGFWEAVKGS